MRLTRLFWVGLKTQPNSYGSRSGRPGYKSEHDQALRDNLGWLIEQALKPSTQKLLPGDTE